MKSQDSSQYMGRRRPEWGQETHTDKVTALLRCGVYSILKSSKNRKKNTKPQLFTWIRQAATFLEPGMRNVELNHLWNVKELAKLICNWDKWRVLIFLLPASPQPAQLSAHEVVPPEAVCHVWPISFSYLISITGFVFPQPIYLALLENSDQDCHQQLYQTMQWC